MSFSLEQILGYPNLTGVIQSVVSGVPEVLPPAFMAKTQTVVGDDGVYTRVKGTRQVARQAMYGSPAVRRQLRQIERVPVKLVHTFEELQLNPLVLQRLMAYDSLSRDQGKMEVARQIGEFGRLFRNLRVSTLMSALFLGHIYFDSSGALLPTSSGSAIDIDFQVPANNQNQLNGIIAASWATASTDIIGHLRSIKKQARRTSGYPLKYAFYGENIPGYFANNTSINAFLSRNPAKNQEYLNTGELPDIAGLAWIPAYEAFYDSSSDSNSESLQSYVGADAVVFTPEVDETWWEWLEGTYFVPSSFDANQNMSAALAALKQVVGAFSYAIPGHNPPTATLFSGDTFLGVVKVPGAIFQADVTP